MVHCKKWKGADSRFSQMLVVSWMVVGNHRDLGHRWWVLVVVGRRVEKRDSGFGAVMEGRQWEVGGMWMVVVGGAAVVAAVIDGGAVVVATAAAAAVVVVVVAAAVVVVVGVGFGVGVGLAFW